MLEELYGLENRKILSHLVKNQTKKTPNQNQNQTNQKKPTTKTNHNTPPKMQTKNNKKERVLSIGKQDVGRDYLCH